MKIRHAEKLVTGLSCLLFTASVSAQDISCQTLLDQINQLSPGSMSYNYQINQAISPKALNRFQTLGEKRDVPRGLHDEIRDTFNHFLVNDCRNNPRQYTHFASERALQTTTEVVKDYLQNRS